MKIFNESPTISGATARIRMYGSHLCRAPLVSSTTSPRRTSSFGSKRSSPILDPKVGSIRRSPGWVPIIIMMEVCLSAAAFLRGQYPEAPLDIGNPIPRTPAPLWNLSAAATPTPPTQDSAPGVWSTLLHLGPYSGARVSPSHGQNSWGSRISTLWVGVNVGVVQCNDRVQDHP